MSIPKVLLAADNDRDMLEYLHEAFQSQVNVCDQCGHEEPTSTCDSALDLNAYLGHFTTPPQPIYDEAKELDLFIEFASDKNWFNPGFKDRDDTKMQFQEEFTDAIWIGWLACAQSRAKAGEDV